VRQVGRVDRSVRAQQPARGEGTTYRLLPSVGTIRNYLVPTVAGTRCTFFMQPVSFPSLPSVGTTQNYIPSLAHGVLFSCSPHLSLHCHLSVLFGTTYRLLQSFGTTRNYLPFTAICRYYSKPTVYCHLSVVFGTTSYPPSLAHGALVRLLCHLSVLFGTYRLLPSVVTTRNYLPSTAIYRHYSELLGTHRRWHTVHWCGRSGEWTAACERSSRREGKELPTVYCHLSVVFGTR
jgi:hypothetical protein